MYRYLLLHSTAPGQKKKRKVVIKVVKKKARADTEKKPKKADEHGSGTAHDPHTALPGQSQPVMSAAEAFDQYAESCGNLDKPSP